MKEGNKEGRRNRKLVIALELHYQQILVHLLKGLVGSLSIFDKNQDPHFLVLIFP